jgi:FAD/FMN-containing dehydrogenase
MDGVISWARQHGVEVVLAPEYPDQPERDPRRDFGGVVRGTPACVLQPASVADLAATLRTLAEQRQPYRLRGGGWSSGGQVIADGGAVVDLTRLDRIVSDRPDASEITVEGGATWVAVCKRLRQTGRRPLAVPDNPHMTVGGSLAIAEVGDTGSVHGTVISQVQRLTLVTPDGEIHRVASEHALFRYALGGAGLTGAIAEATIRTMVRPATLWARTLGWRDLPQFFGDAQTNCDLRLYEIFQGMLSWVEDAPVAYQLAGNFGAAHQAGEPGLYEIWPNAVTVPEGRDRLEALSAPIPWDRMRPGLVLRLPLVVGVEALGQLSDFVRSEPVLRKHVASVGILVMKPDRRFPLAPWPEGSHLAVLVVRPTFPTRDQGLSAEIVPLLRTVAQRALELGGRIGHGSIDLELEDLARLQFGSELEELRRLRAKTDPEGLCNRGIFPGLDAVD